MTALAQRYASAFADVVLERKIGKEAAAQLREFADAFAASAELRNFLETPAVPRPAKEEMVAKLAGRMGFHETVQNFLRVIVDHRRMALVGEIALAFDAELSARLGIAEAQVTSARELAAEEKTALVIALERMTGKKVEARYATDAGLVGGAVVRIGSTVYDGSVREQLDRLRARLTSE